MQINSPKTFSENIIRPGWGYGMIRFGMKEQEVRSFFVPDKITLDDDGLIFSSKVHGIDMLFFDKEEEYRFVTIELNSNSQATLWGHSIFQHNIDELQRISRETGYSIIKDSERTPGLEEYLYKIEAIECDFYAAMNGTITTISFGVIFDSLDRIRWPQDIIKSAGN